MLQYSTLSSSLPPSLSIAPNPIQIPNNLVPKLSEPSSRQSWTESLRSQIRSNSFREAVNTFIQMQTNGILPDNFIFPAVLKAATSLRDLDLGKQIHASAVKLGYDLQSVTVANTLLHMYAQCGGDGLENVFKVFDKMPQKDQVSLNSLINALCRYAEWGLALDAFRFMISERFEPSSFTLVSVALACSNLNRFDGLRLGKQVHGYSLKVEDTTNAFTVNALMSMYAKLGSLDYAKTIFEMFGSCNMISWNTVISGFSQNDRFYEALEYFRVMIEEGFKPDGVAVASVLPACSHLELLNIGREIHAYVYRNEEFLANSFVASALVDMYCNCKQVLTGRKVFDGALDRKLALWNAMLAGYTQNGFYMDALSLFMKLMVESDLFPNAMTMASVLPACVHSKGFEDKEVIHGYVLKLGLGRDRYVQNALMDLYSRIGKIESSKYIFRNMESKDVVSWNTMITGFVVCGRHEDALVMLKEMQVVTGAKENSGKVSFKPNSVTLMAILPGCALLAALTKGQEIHGYAIRNALASDVGVGSALVDMYAKCGSLVFGRRAFESMPRRNVITWNVIIMAYGMHGDGEEALALFRRMVNEGEVTPNEVTFIAVITACSHSGMVDEGQKLFHSMKDAYGVEPKSDHYGCVVDLLGRAGKLDEAYEFITSMPRGVDKVGAWSSLLGNCKTHQNVELGEISARNLLELEPSIASHYVLLSNIYSSAGLWEKAESVRRNMKENGVRKEPGCSWIEYGDEVHKFVAGDTSHPQSARLYDFLKDLFGRLKEEGYVADTSCVLHNVEEREKESLLCGHSERLAIAFGLLNTPAGSTIRVAKNLRVCNDCHSATKFISKIVGREIVVRDVRRFHHFNNGVCSCGDYW